MFYIFYGQEELLRAEAVAGLRARMAEEDLGELNTASLDGRDLPLEELINACNTLPFLTQRRMIIVHDMLQRYDRAASAPEAQRLADYLPSMPDTTRLVFVESGALAKNNQLLARAKGLSGATIREYAPFPPESEELRRWVAQRARTHGVATEPQAVRLLIELVGNNLRSLDQELAKLAGRLDYAGAVRAEDVRALVSPSPQADIFGMVDALGVGNHDAALRLFHTLLADDAKPLYLLAMISRQIRLILAAKDLQENERLDRAALAKRLGVPPFVAEKLLEQSRLFSFQDLHKLLERVLEVDQGIKTGQIEPVLSLELLILAMCQCAARPQRARNRSRTRRASATSRSSPEARSR
jgi:DNA polymerase III subunit delta